MEFDVRCKGLAQRVIRIINDTVAQRIHWENADHMCLASFVVGLTGVLIVKIVMPILEIYRKL